MIKLSPSLLSADFSNLAQEIKAVEKAGATYLHLDIMDGHFVPNITFGAPVVKSLRKVSDIIFDVHLMIERPQNYIMDFIKAGADIINVHQEACENLPEILTFIKEQKVKAAVTLRPKTPITKIESVLPLVDMVLIMSVEPGFGGQKMIPETLEKIKYLAQVRKEKNFSYEIEIDGGVSLSNLRQVLDAGTDIVVAGSAIFGTENSAQTVQKFLQIFKEYETR